MKLKRTMLLLSCMAFLGLLLFFPSTAVDGSRRGLILWFQVLIPTLLPFFILSSMLRCLVTKKSGTALFLAIGIFSGYPIGARIVGIEYLHGNLSKRQAYFFLNLCNQASPMFLLVFTGIQTLHLGAKRYIFFLLIHISSLIGSLLLSACKNRKKEAIPALIKESHETPSLSETLDHILLESMATISKIGCYVILFSILASFVNTLLSNQQVIGICISGFFEITTGMLELERASLPVSAKIVLASVLISFGGLSALAQTKSVLPETGLSIPIYLLHKAVSACTAFFLSLLLVCIF